MAGYNVVTVEREPTTIYRTLEKIAFDIGPNLVPSTQDPAQPVNLQCYQLKAVGIENTQQITRQL